MEAQAPMTYDQVRDVYEKLYNHPSFEGMDLPSFAGYANYLTGTEQFTSGLNDNMLLRLNYRLNKALRPVSEGTKELGELAAGAVGIPEKIGGQIGEYLPRGLIETGLLFAPGPTPQKAALVAKGAQLAARGLGATLSGTETLSQTGSEGAGLFAGVTSFALPTAVHAAERAGVGLFAKQLGYTGQTLPETGAAVLSQAPRSVAGGIAERGIEAASRELAFAVAGEAQLQGVSKIATGEFAPYDSEHLTMLAASQLPFALLDVAGVVKAPKTGARGSKFEEKALLQRVEAEKTEAEAKRQAVQTAEENITTQLAPDKLKETLALAETDAKKVMLKRVAGITHNKLNKVMRTGQAVDLTEFTTYLHEGKQLARSVEEMLVVQDLLDSAANRGLVKIENDRVVPIARMDLEGQVLMDIRGGSRSAEARVKFISETKGNWIDIGGERWQWGDVGPYGLRYGPEFVGREPVPQPPEKVGAAGVSDQGYMWVKEGSVLANELGLNDLAKRLQESSTRMVKRTSGKVEVEGVTVPSKEYKGPTFEQIPPGELQEPARPLLKDVTDIQSGQAWLDDHHRRLMRALNTLMPKWVTKTKKRQDKTKVEVGHQEFTYMKRPEYTSVDVKRVNDTLLAKVIEQLKSKGVDAKPSDFNKLPEPPQFSFTSTPMSRAIGRLLDRQNVTDQIHTLVMNKRPKVDEEGTPDLPIIAPDVADKLNYLKDLGDEVYWNLRARAKETSLMAKDLRALDEEFGHNVRELERVSPTLGAKETERRYYNILADRARKMYKLWDNVTEATLSEAVGQMARYLPEEVAQEAGIPATVEQAVFEALSAYGDGPILQALVDVVEKTPIKTMLGMGKTKTGRVSEMLNDLAMFRLYEWTARLIRAKKNLEEGKVAQGETNLWQLYKSRQVERGLGVSDYDIAQAGIQDLALLANKTSGERFGRRQGGTPADEFDIEAAHWMQRGGREITFTDQFGEEIVTAGLLDAEDPMVALNKGLGDLPGSMNEPEARALADIAAEASFFKGIGNEELVEGTEIAAFWDDVMAELPQLKIDANTLKTQKRLRLVANEDFTLDHETMSRSAYGAAERVRGVEKLQGTIEVLSYPEQFGFVPRLAKNEEGRLAFVLQIESVGGSREIPMWNVVERTKTAGPELTKLHNLLYEDDAHLYAALVEKRYDAVKEQLGDVELFHKMKQRREAYADDDVGARHALRLMQRELTPRYKEVLKNTYNNWRTSASALVLEIAIANAYAKRYGPRVAEMLIAQGGEKGTTTRAGVQKLAAQLHTDAEPMQTAIGLQAFFKDEFVRKGLGAAEAEYFGEIATKIGLAFPRLQNGVIARLVNPELAGVYYAIGYKQFLVGLNPESWRGFTGRERSVAVMQTIAHEMSHALFDPANWSRLTGEQVGALTKMNQWARSLSSEERQLLLNDWFQTILPVLAKTQTPEGVQQLIARLEYSAQRPEEFLADYTSLAVLGLASPDNVTKWQVVGDRFAFGTSHEQQVLKGFFLPMTDMMDALGAHFRKNPMFEQEGIELQATATNLKRMLSTTSSMIDEAFAAVQRLEQFEPGVYEQALARGLFDETMPYSKTLDREFMAKFGESRTSELRLPPVISGFLAGSRTPAWERTAGVQPNFYERWFMVSAVLAKRFPVLAPMIDLSFRYYGIANDAAHKIAQPMLRKKKLLGLVTLSEGIDYEATGIKVLLKDPKAAEVATKIALLKQGDVSTGENIQVFSDQIMFKLMDRFGLKDQKGREAVLAFHRNAETIAPRHRQLVLDMLPRVLGKHLAKVVMSKSKAITAKTALERGMFYADAQWKAMQSDPLVQAQGTQMLATLTPDEFKISQMVIEPLQQLKQFADRTNGKNGYMPELRTGRWVVVYWEKVGNEWVGGSQAFDDKAMRDAAIAKLEDKRTKGLVKGIKGWDRWDRKEAYSGSNPALMQLMRDTEKGALENVLIQQGYGPQDISTLLGEYTPLEASMRAAEQTGVDRFLRQRKIAPGRESINLVEGFLRNVTMTARALAKMDVTAEAAARLADPSLDGNYAMQNLARRQFDSVVNPSASEFTTLKKGIFSYFMGFNLSSLLIEMTQPFLTLIPGQTRDTGNPLIGYKYFGKANSLLVKRSMSNGRTGHAELDGPNGAIARAIREQVWDFGVMQEFYNADELATLNLSSLLQGGQGAWSPTKWAKAALNTYTQVAKAFYGMAPQYNNATAFVSSYLIAREHGVLQGGKLTKLTPEAAYEYAKVSTRSTMGGGGVAARPVELFSRMGKAQGVVGAMYSLSGYTFLMMSHIARLGLDAIDRRKGLTVSERKAAATALGQTLMTQTALAGFMGVPMVTATLAVLEQMFPGLEPYKAVNDFVQQLVDEDEEGGGFFSDFLMRGFPFAKVGVDLSSRLQLSNIMGVSGYDGFSLENLMGPAGSMIGNMVKAAQQASTGEFGQAVETALPTAFKNVAKMYRDEWIVRDSRGRPLLEPTPKELLLELTGFRPSSLVRLREAQRMAERGDEVERKQLSLFHQKVAREMLAGNTAMAQQMLLEKQQLTAGYSAVEGARSVAELVTQQLYPLDFARTGVRVNAADRQRLAEQGGVQRVPEMARLQTKKRLEAALGVPGAGRVTRSEARLAMLIDQLRMSNPFLSVQEAREQAVMILGGQVPQLAPAGQTMFGR